MRSTRIDGRRETESGDVGVNAPEPKAEGLASKGDVAAAPSPLSKATHTVESHRRRGDDSQAAKDAASEKSFPLEPQIRGQLEQMPPGSTLEIELNAAVPIEAVKVAGRGTAKVTRNEDGTFDVALALGADFSSLSSDVSMGEFKGKPKFGLVEGTVLHFGSAETAADFSAALVNSGFAVVHPNAAAVLNTGLELAKLSGKPVDTVLDAQIAVLRAVRDRTTQVSYEVNGKVDFAHESSLAIGVSSGNAAGKTESPSQTAGFNVGSAGRVTVDFEKLKLTETRSLTMGLEVSLQYAKLVEAMESTLSMNGKQKIQTTVGFERAVTLSPDEAKTFKEGKADDSLRSRLKYAETITIEAKFELDGSGAIKGENRLKSALTPGLANGTAIVKARIPMEDFVAMLEGGKTPADLLLRSKTTVELQQRLFGATDNFGEVSIDVKIASAGAKMKGSSFIKADGPSLDEAILNFKHKRELHSEFERFRAQARLQQ